MKKCKIYSTAKNSAAEAVIIDGHVLLLVPRRDDIEPTHISDGQCYYPPLYATAFAEDMNFDLVPFSTECEWGEYNNNEESKVHGWFEYYAEDNYSVKCGYCDTKTGRICIPPEMEYCEDFNAYGAAIFGSAVDDTVEECVNRGVARETAERWMRTRDGVYSGLIDTTGEIISCRGYVGIEKSHHGIFFVYQTADGWGVADSTGDELIELLQDGFSWDGMGGFTIMDRDRKREGQKTYGIINSESYSCERVTEGLTCEPFVYDFPPEKRWESLSLDESFHSERFRLTQRDDNYGLVRDVLENLHDPLSTYSEEILKPLYRYEEIPNAAYEAWMEREIHYYARVMASTPLHVPGRVGDSWDTVPKKIRDNVRVCMMAMGWEQPEG